MTIWIWFFAAFLLVDLIIVWWIWSAKRGKRLSEKERAEFRQRFHELSALADGHRSIMEADKLLDAVLSRLGYRGTLGEKLKKADPVFSDANAVWNAHKLRNRLAHELDAKVSESERRSALSAFKTAMKELGV